MAWVDFKLVNHESSLSKLMATMKRVGVAFDPEEFIRLVSNAYHEVEAQRHAVDMHAYFRNSGGYENFKQSLQMAKKAIDRPVSILNVGCGAGWDLEVMREVFSNEEVKKVVCCDISADMQAIARQKANGYPCRFVLARVNEALVYGPYDLVVTHAMVHHVADLASFLSTITRAVVPGGAYVMGHEPNNRFWVNEECQSYLRRMRTTESRRRRMTKYLKPSAYVFKAARMLGVTADDSLEERINRILRTRHGFKSNLTPQEIRRLVDVHVPDWFAGDFKIGLDGFEWDHLQSDFLQSFTLAWVGTSSYLGETCSASDLPERWQDVDLQLAKKYPLDGSNFSAFWWKKE
jgi:2-polyprenyl-3-methyl-5-hydroxy-6-metoxy-1,4-benzoquinol methylase